jgi:hypothetical protein
MFNISKKQEKSAVWTYTVIWALIGFVTLYFLSQAILTAVYGIELPASYHQTVLVTQNASNFTEGLQIDSYIQLIKDETCHTLNNSTLEAECQKL